MGITLVAMSLLLAATQQVAAQPRQPQPRVDISTLSDAAMCSACSVSASSVADAVGRALEASTKNARDGTATEQERRRAEVVKSAIRTACAPSAFSGFVEAGTEGVSGPSGRKYVHVNELHSKERLRSGQRVKQELASACSAFTGPVRRPLEQQLALLREETLLSNKAQHLMCRDACDGILHGEERDTEL